MQLKIKIAVEAVFLAALISVAYSLSSSNPSLKNSGKPFTSWRKKLDVLLDPRLPLNERRILSRDLLNDIPDISRDVQTAIQRGGPRALVNDIILTPGSEARRTVEGIATVRRQLNEDIIPELRKNQTPENAKRNQERLQKLIREELPKQVDYIARELPKQLSKLDLSPSSVFKTIRTVQDESFNIVSRTPSGLFTPPYDVIFATDDETVPEEERYEIRSYKATSIALTRMEIEKSSETTNANGVAFNILANYLFGGNKSNSSMEMTTPVSIDLKYDDESVAYKSMGFVLPENMSAENAPAPNNENIVLKDIPERLVAVREFTGFATPKEACKQLEMLKKAISADGWVLETPAEGEPDSELLQYNPPITLPWLRRNEVVVRVLNKTE